MKNKGIIPEYWEELTQPQFEYLLRKVFVMMSNTDITKEDVLNDFAHYLCGRKHYIHPFRKTEYMLLVAEVARLLSWIFVTANPSASLVPLEKGQSEQEEVILNYDTVINLLPRIGKLVGPQSAGYDLRFGEYRKACWMYNEYTTNHNIDALDGLVGILYRKPQSPKGVKSATFTGEYREHFNEFHIDRYAKRVKHVAEHIKWGVYLWFSYFCKHLMSGEFTIEGNEVSFAPLFSTGGDPDGKKDENLGMTSVLFTLAETHTFGNIDETDNALLFKVMLKLLSDHQTAENLKKQ